MTWSLPEPMLTVAVDSPALPAGWEAEPKWDGYRAQLAVHADGQVLLCSRRDGCTAADVPHGPPADRAGVRECGSAGVLQQAAGASKAPADGVERPAEIALARPVTQLPTGPSWAS
ncbi:hypothetical protein [Streptomyces acidicola]|uniref:hypothetical protein n=1 Tax=Streptomyces acidicola TaxID=2596892 RepID=UPI00343B397F